MSVMSSNWKELKERYSVSKDGVAYKEYSTKVNQFAKDVVPDVYMDTKDELWSLSSRVLIEGMMWLFMEDSAFYNKFKKTSSFAELFSDINLLNRYFDLNDDSVGLGPNDAELKLQLNSYPKLLPIMKMRAESLRKVAIFADQELKKTDLIW